MTAVCRCDHPHLPGATGCYACGLPLAAAPIDVPPALTVTPPPSAGGTQAQEVRNG